MNSLMLHQLRKNYLYILHTFVYYYTIHIVELISTFVCVNTWPGEIANLIFMIIVYYIRAVYMNTRVCVQKQE